MDSTPVKGHVIQRSISLGMDGNKFSNYRIPKGNCKGSDA